MVVKMLVSNTELALGLGTGEDSQPPGMGSSGAGNAR